MTTNQLADEISKKKSGVLKWVLLGCAGLVIIVVAALGVIGYLAYRTFNTDPAEAELAVQEILPLDIPAGFSGRFSMSMMGMKMATLGSSDDSRIVLMAMPRSKASPEAMRKQMLDNLARQGQAQAEYGERRASETFRLRGADIQGQVDAGGRRNSEHLRYSFLLEGANGEVVMLMAAGNEKDITHEWVQNLLDSVK